MRRSTLFGSISLVALASLLAVATASEAHARRGGGGGMKLERMAELAGVDATTKAQIEQVAAQSRAESQALRTQVQRERRALRQLMQQDAPSEAAVLAQADRVSALKLKLRKLRLKTMLRARALLTPEQRKKLLEARKNRRAERGKACHHRGGRGKDQI